MNYSPPYIYTGLYLEPDKQQPTIRVRQSVTVRPVVIPYYVVAALLILILGFPVFILGSLYLSI